MREQQERSEQLFINVKIKTLNHSIYDIIVNPLKSISSFQNQIQQKTAVPLDSQRLLYRGFVLDPEKTLADYRIEEGNIIQLVANKIPSQHSHQSSIKRSDITRTNTYNKEHNKTKKYRQLQERLNGFRMKREQSLQTLQQNKHTIDQLLECLNHNFLQDVSPFKFQRRKMAIGEWVDVRDASGQWIEGQVVNKYGEYVYIHYNGLHTRWNQWISVTSERIMPFRTHTVQLTSKTPYMSPFPSYEREIPTKNNVDFQTNIQNLVYEVTSTLDSLSNLMKELQFTPRGYMKDESLNNVSHIQVPRLGPTEPHLENEIQQIDINENKEYFETPGKDSAVIGDNISNKCEDDRSNKCDNDDVSSKKSFKSKRSEGLVDTASMKSLTIDESRKRQNKVFFDRAEEAQSVRSVCPKKSSKNFNFYNQDNQEYIVEETSQFEEQEYEEAGLFEKKELKRKMKASQLAPLLDRMGRFLIDIAPHIAMLGHTDQLVSASLNENLSTYTNEGSLLSKLSEINKNTLNGHPNTHSSQNISAGKMDLDENNQQERGNSTFCSFQVPIMLTPQELLRLQKLLEAQKRNMHML